MWYRILKTEEFESWFDDEMPKSQVQIEKRLSNIELYGHFGEHKSLTEFVWELKWKNGRRVYYAFIEDKNILLLLGGNKNGQNEDITKSQTILEKYTQASS